MPGYTYSEALTDIDLVWTEETIHRLFAEGPDVVTPGSKMPVQKIATAEELDALVAFLKRATVPASDAGEATEAAGE